jgi:hypothetical protein
MMDIGQIQDLRLALLAHLIMNVILVGNLDAQEATSPLELPINVNHALMVWCAQKPLYF